MVFRLYDRLVGFERHLRENTGRSIATPAERRRAWWHFQLLDHAFLRAWWTNLHRIAPGVWRANQPSPKRLARYRHKLGLKAVLNLRGETGNSHYLFEAEACDALGIVLVNIRLNARALPKPDQLLALLDAFETTPRPFLMHCKSGSDRAGLAAALYRIHVEGRPVAEAADELHWRYLHAHWTKTGILDFFLQAYAADNAAAPIALRDWIETRYDRSALDRAYRARRGGRDV
jgi:protein tyrosine/serine phosphatase